MGNSSVKKITAGFAVIFILAVYILTVYPAYKNNDSPETAAAAYLLGISHPPGYPLFNIAAKTFSLVPAGNIAFRVNLFSIFTAILVLLFTYHAAVKVIKAVFAEDSRLIGVFSVLLTAFSSVFWSQAIEAKGGIYILNMLFLLIMFILWLDLLEGFKPSKLYMLTFITAVALTNHWPSVVILTPVSLWFYFKNHGSISKKSLLIHLVLFLAGISAYVYLPVRGGTDGVFAFMAKPDTWENFWWTVLRSGYFTGTEAVSNVMQNQIMEWLKVTAVNYSFLSLFALPGIYAAYKNNRKVFYVLSVVYVLTLFFVLAVNRAPKDVIWVIRLFLLPALYVQLLFIVLGMAWILSRIKRRLYKKAAVLIISAASLSLLLLNWKSNDNSKNYIFYDFADNVIRTMDRGGIYMGEGDFYTMFIPYEQNIRKRMKGIEYISPFAMDFQWGIDDFQQKYGKMDMKPGFGGMNSLTVINRFAGMKDVFMTRIEKSISGKMEGRSQKVHGLIYKIADLGEKIPAGLFDIYNYRGIGSAESEYDKLMVSFYGARIADAAVDSFMAGDYGTAVFLGEKAVKMPGTSRNAAVYYNLAVAYHYLMDKSNVLKYLKKTIELDPKHAYAYEMAGKAYYNDFNYPMALEMFENAVRHGNPNSAALRKYIDNIKGTDTQTQMLVMYNKGVAMLEEGNYAGAMDVFEYMLKQGVMRADIYRGIGIYHYKKGDFKAAIDYFEKSLKESRSSAAYLYISYSLAQTGKKSEALKKLQEGIKYFPEDSRLKQAFEMLNK